MSLRIGVVAGLQSEEIGGGWTFAATLIEALKNTQSSHQFLLIDALLQSPSAPKPTSGFPTNLPMTFAERIEKTIEREKLDLVWYLIPNAIPLSVPFITTVWDLEHRKQPYFPEVSIAGWRWTERETYYRGVLPRAAFLLIGTEQGKKEVVDFYGVSAARIKVVPLPTPQMFPPSETDIAGVMQKHGLPRGFLFYPAQFWPHKNHANLLRALDVLRRDRGLCPSLALTGSDQGNRDYVRELISGWDLSAQVFDLGFVPREDLACLYASAAALVYPSFFGPDNLPPLEAFASGCPVVVADVPGAREQLAEAALYFNPSDPQEIAVKITEILRNEDCRRRLITDGMTIARQRTPQAYVSAICALLDEFEPIRRCWGSPAPILTDTNVSFAQGEDGSVILKEGWSVEQWGAWSIQERCSLRFNLGKFAGRPLYLAFAGRTFQTRNLRVACHVNEGFVQQWEFSAPKGGAFSHRMTEKLCRLRIDPNAVRSNGDVNITFLISNPASPAELGLSGDTRGLGIGLERMRIVLPWFR